jgi:hypothetical protein
LGFCGSDAASAAGSDPTSDSFSDTAPLADSGKGSFDTPADSAAGSLPSSGTEMAFSNFAPDSSGTSVWPVTGKPQQQKTSIALITKR